jgi:hypothetical protein
VSNSISFLSRNHQPLFIIIVFSIFNSSRSAKKKKWKTFDRQQKRGNSQCRLFSTREVVKPDTFTYVDTLTLQASSFPSRFAFIMMKMTIFQTTEFSLSLHFQLTVISSPSYHMRHFLYNDKFISLHYFYQWSSSDMKNRY